MTTKPTHFCKKCGARWVQWEDTTWSLTDQSCGECCDNAKMGKQIAPLLAKPREGV